VRTDSQEEQGFEVGVAGGVDVLRRSSPGGPGSASRRAERELIVVGGIRPPRASAGVEETGGDKAREVASRKLVADRVEAGGPERGARFL
jgi:hypothetical protein